MAPGPWIYLPQNPGYFEGSSLAGELIEAKGFDDEGSHQGNYIGIVESQHVVDEGADDGKGTRIRVKVLGASDKDYWGWTKDQPDQVIWYYLSKSAAAKPKPIKKGRRLAHPINSLRLLTYIEDQDLGVDWVSKRSAALKHIQTAFGRKSATRQAAADAHSAKAERRQQRRVQSDGEEAEISKRTNRRVSWKDEITAAERTPATGPSDEEGHERGRRRERTPPRPREPEARGKASVISRGARNATPAKTDGGRPRAFSSEDEDDDYNDRPRNSGLETDLRGLREELFTGSRPAKREERNVKPREEDCPRRARDSGERKTETDTRRKKDRDTSDKEETVEIPEVRKRPFGTVDKDRKRKRAKTDRRERPRRRETLRSGSDDSGTESCSSDASQVFREASSSTSKPSRKRLIQFADHHPGRLAERFLNRMARKVMVEGEAAPAMSCRLPIVAKAYHLRVTSQKHGEASRRHLGETAVVATVLDHLAAQRYDRAADVLAQRYTALEAMMSGLPWDRARFLELTTEEDNTLVGQHERALMANEAANASKRAISIPLTRARGLGRARASRRTGRTAREQEKSGTQEKGIPLRIR